MRAWSRIDPDRYRRMPLRAHALLADVPVLDVWRVELPGGGPSRTMKDVRSAIEAGRRARPLPLVVRALFGLRWLAGRAFGWDRPRSGPEAPSFRARLSEEDVRRSLVEPGTLDGRFAVLYVHDREAVSEVRNATVHALLVWVLEPAPDGYELLWAIHVLPVGRWTTPYLTLIRPFRHGIVYPAILRHIRASWIAWYGAVTGPG